MKLIIFLSLLLPSIYTADIVAQNSLYLTEQNFTLGESEYERYKEEYGIVTTDSFENWKKKWDENLQASLLLKASDYYYIVNEKEKKFSPLETLWFSPKNYEIIEIVIPDTIGTYRRNYENSDFHKNTNFFLSENNFSTPDNDIAEKLSGSVLFGLKNHIFLVSPDLGVQKVSELEDTYDIKFDLDYDLLPTLEVPILSSFSKKYQNHPMYCAFLFDNSACLNELLASEKYGIISEFLNNETYSDFPYTVYFTDTKLLDTDTFLLQFSKYLANNSLTKKQHDTLLTIFTNHYDDIAHKNSSSLSNFIEIVRQTTPHFTDYLQ